MERGMTSVHMKTIPASSMSHAGNHHNPELRQRLYYVHHDRTQYNERWDREVKASGKPKTLTNYFTAIKNNVKHKTQRSMQKRAMDVAIQDALVNIDEYTTMDDLKRFARAMEKEFGFTCIQIHIHRDEGYMGKKKNGQQGKLNLHAHVIFETVNRETGKTWKPEKNRGSRMQDIAAETLGMKRGVPKEITKKKGLNIIEYKEQQALNNLEEINKDLQKAQKELQEAKDAYEVGNKVNNNLKAEISKKNQEIKDLSIKYTQKIQNQEEQLKQDKRKALEKVKEDFEKEKTEWGEEQLANINAGEVLKQIFPTLYNFLNECRKIGLKSIKLIKDIWSADGKSVRDYNKDYSCKQSEGKLKVNGIYAFPTETVRAETKKVPEEPKRTANTLDIEKLRASLIDKTENKEIDIKPKKPEIKKSKGFKI